MRKALVVIGFAALACGGQDSGTTAAPGADAGDTPAVSAVQPPPSEVDIEEMDEAAVEDVGGEEIVEVTSCLELVETGKYVEAVTICQTAVSKAPDNAEVAAALAKAQAQAAAGAAADAATAAAKDSAAGAIDSAAGAAKDAIGAGQGTP